MSAPLSTIGQPPVFRLKNVPFLDLNFNSLSTEIIKKLANQLNLNDLVPEKELNFSIQIQEIKEIELQQDDIFSLRQHRFKSLGYAVGTVFFAIIAGISARYPVTKTVRISTRIISFLGVFMNSTKAYNASKKWCSENAVNKKHYYWIPVYNEIRYLYNAFLAKSGLNSAHKSLTEALNKNLKLCEAIEENLEQLQYFLTQDELAAVSEAIKQANHISNSIRQKDL